MPAPRFTLEDVYGGSYSLETGAPILISFIDPTVKATLGTNEPSRAQIVFLKSMHEQYSSKGLVVWIVDASRLATGRRPDRSDLINFMHDWQLGDIPLLEDIDGSVAGTWGVKSAPVTFLFNAEGITQQRWEGFASSSQLALAIEPLMGAPAFRDIGATQNIPLTSTCAKETPPQARFSGVGLARPFSGQLWVVDGGTLWGSGAAFPVQFVFLDTQNIAQEQAVHIQVFIEGTETSQEILLLDQEMELLQVDVASGLLSGADNPPVIYSLVTSVQIENPGCLDVHAVITQEGNATPLYQGTLTIPAR